MVNIYENLETPCFVIDKSKLDYNINNINEGRKILKNSIIGYSIKTNSLLWLIEYLNNNTDYYFEVVSPEEYNYVSKTGVSVKRIIYNGPCKSFESIKFALLNGSIVNIDTFNDLSNINKLNFPANIGIRVNVTNNTSEDNYIKFGYTESRFGFSYQNGDLKRVIESLNNNINISGLHFHINNKCRSVDNYITIVNIVNEIVNKNHLSLDYIDFGGGYKGGYGNNFIEYTRVIYDNLNIPNKDNITYIFEPGAALIATPVSYLMQVVDIKSINDKRYILLNGGRTQVDPTFSNKKYQYTIYSNINEKIDIPQVLNGFTCMENDRFMTIDSGKKLMIGDIIKLDNLGAYTMTLLPFFIKGYPPVYLQDNDDIYMIKERQDLANIMGVENGRVYKKII